MANGFRDFIPEGEDNGAITVNGYQDFVPDTETVSEAKATVLEAEPVNPKFSCPECGFVAKAKIGLAGHMRKHK